VKPTVGHGPYFRVKSARVVPAITYLNVSHQFTDEVGPVKLAMNPILLLKKEIYLKILLL
jgi:hypothetical protein